MLLNIRAIFTHTLTYACMFRSNTVTKREKKNINKTTEITRLGKIPISIKTIVYYRGI